MKRVIEHAREVFNRDLAAARRQMSVCRGHLEVANVRYTHAWYVRGAAEALLGYVDSVEELHELLALKDRYIETLMRLEPSTQE